MDCTSSKRECPDHANVCANLPDDDGKKLDERLEVVTRSAATSKDCARLPGGFDPAGLDQTTLKEQCTAFCAGLGHDARTFAKYSNTQLEPAFEKLVSGGSAAHQETIRLYAQLIASLASSPVDVCKPTPEVHLVWISHLLRSHRYRSDCNEYFGCFVDHSLAAVESVAGWETFKAELASKQGQIQVHADAVERFAEVACELLPMEVLKCDMEFFKHLQQSFHGEMHLGFLGDWLVEPSSTIQPSLTSLDALLERHYYTHLLVASRMRACGHPGINPVFHVDWLWHTHVISPSKHYHACVDAFGDVVHHTPGPILEDSRPIWRTLFGKTPAEEITEVLGPLQTHRTLKVAGMGGSELVTLTLQGHESAQDIKNMIEQNGGPVASKQRLVQSNGTQFDRGDVSDIPLDTGLTLVVVEKRVVNLVCGQTGRRANVEVTGDESCRDIKRLIGGSFQRYHCAIGGLQQVCSDLKKLPEGEDLVVNIYDPSCG